MIKDAYSYICAHCAKRHGPPLSGPRELPFKPCCPEHAEIKGRKDKFGGDGRMKHFNYNEK
jgi:hypothetical protein